MIVTALVQVLATVAAAQVPSVLSGGPPVIITPYVFEPGVPAFQVPPGTTNPFAGADALLNSGVGGAGATGGGVLGVLPDVAGPTVGATAVSGSGSTLTYTNPDGTTTTLSGGSAAWRNNNPGNLVKNRYP